jgi:hypothetical protein
MSVFYGMVPAGGPPRKLDLQVMSKNKELISAIANLVNFDNILYRVIPEQGGALVTHKAYNINIFIAHGYVDIAQPYAVRDLVAFFAALLRDTRLRAGHFIRLPDDAAHPDRLWFSYSMTVQLSSWRDTQHAPGALPDGVVMWQMAKIDNASGSYFIQDIKGPLKETTNASTPLYNLGCMYINIQKPDLIYHPHFVGLCGKPYGKALSERLADFAR